MHLCNAHFFFLKFYVYLLVFFLKTGSGYTASWIKVGVSSEFYSCECRGPTHPIPTSSEPSHVVPIHHPSPCIQEWPWPWGPSFLGSPVGFVLATLLYIFSVTCPCLIMWHHFLGYVCGLLPLSLPVRCTMPWARDDCILLSSGTWVFSLHSGTCCCPSCTWASCGGHRKGTAAWTQRVLCSPVSGGVQQQRVTSQGLLCLHVSFPSGFFFFSLLRKLFTLWTQALPSLLCMWSHLWLPIK